MTGGSLVVVTGVTRGLGRALARALVERGHRLAGCGRSAENLESLRAELGAAAKLDVVDVADSDDVARWAAQVLQSLGTPQLVIANAAVINRPAPLWQVPAAEFDRLLAVNIGGIAAVARGFLPAMMEAGEGVLVGISSEWGRTVSAEVAPYCASKWAVEGLMRALALELPPGLAAVTVSPGVVDTEMLRSCLPEVARSCVSPREWAEAAVDGLLGLGPKDNGRSLDLP